MNFYGRKWRQIEEAFKDQVIILDPSETGIKVSIYGPNPTEWCDDLDEDRGPTIVSYELTAELCEWIDDYTHLGSISDEQRQDIKERRIAFERMVITVQKTFDAVLALPPMPKQKLLTSE
jgi:hypothetical protein